MLRKLIDLLAAQAALLYAQILLWTRPAGRLLVRSDGAPVAPPASGAVPDRVRRLALAVERAAEYGLFRPSCLVRAVAVQRLLESRGFAGSWIRVGIRQEGGRLLAHAWVDYRGNVLADQEWRVKKFEELARMGVTQVS